MTDELAYEPKRIQVEAGTTVTFENIGNVSHTVTAYEDKLPEGAEYFASGGFDSEQVARNAWFGKAGGVISSNETYEQAFEVPGRYEYFCIPHEPAGMVGTVVVGQ
ncbi:hypothetical protein BRC77_05375 [Halobacteriales archaeon QH_8_64_26]|nr:MAG: hypothetical protein BRC77_05375 [Halobacteriales archaeon QH_8_64_26]